MDTRKVQLLLTEVALNLLGNTFYDINGSPVDNLSDLYKSDESGDQKRSSKPHLLDVLDNIEAEEQDDQVVASPGDESYIDVTDTSSEDSQDVFVVNNDEITNDEITNDEAGPSNPPTATTMSYGETSKSPSYLSPDITERLKYLSRATNVEYERMMKHSDEQRTNYMDSRRHTHTSRSLLDDFHDAQRTHLQNELRSLLQFIRLVKTNDRVHSEEVIRAMKDILASKKYVDLSTNVRDCKSD